MELKEGTKFSLNKKTRRWIAPDQSKCKINTDVDVDRVRSKRVVGVVCRNGRGEFIAASAMVISNIRALTMQTLSWSLKLFITSNNMDFESK